MNALPITSGPALRFLVAAAVVFAVGAQVSSQTKKSDSLSLDLGSETVLIPRPEGLQEVVKRSLLLTFWASETPQSDLLAAYVSDSDSELVERGEMPLMHYYAKIAIPKVRRRRHDSSSVFEAVVAEFRKGTAEYLNTDTAEIKKSLKNLEQQISKNNSVDAELEISKPKNVGVFNVSPNTYSVLLLSTVKLESGAKEAQRLVLAGASLVYVKNRILGVTCYRTYESEADLEKMKDSVMKWTNSILAANESK